MANLDADIPRDDRQRKIIRLGVALGWLCLAAVARAAADGPVPATPSFVSATAPITSPAIPAAFNGLQSHPFGQTTDLLSRLTGDAANPVTIPLNVQFGQNSGVSFLYNLAAGQTSDGQKVASAPRAATYGFSNALALSHDSVHLNGLMYFANGQGADGQNKQSQLISQALAFENKGWKFDAHYQSVGKDFGGGDTLKNAAGKMGLAASLSDAAANQLEGLRGQNDLGFSLAHSDTHGSFGFLLKENDNQISHLKTTEQTLSLGRTFGHGLQFEASRDTISAKPGQGADPNQALTTTTNHLKLGMDQGKGMSFSAEANTIGDSHGRAEEHMAYHFADQLKDTQFQTTFLTNSVKANGSPGASDQTLNLDFSRQTKGLSLKGSLLQFRTTAPDGQGKTNENLEMNWQARKDVTVAAHWTQASLLTNSTGKTDLDRTLSVDIARQGQGLTWKASFLQDTPTGDKTQAKTTQHFEMDWQARKDLTLQGHWTHVAAEDVHSDGGANRDEQRDLTATLSNLHLRWLRNSQMVMNLAQEVSQGKNQNDTRALTFVTDMPDTHVQMEYTGRDLGWDKDRNSLVSRAVRIASISPGDWLHYSAYYKQRSQTMGGRLPDVRDYLVGMQIRHVAIAYHYLNQQEQKDGSVKDTVESHYTMDGPLTKKLAWNLQYDQTNDRADKSGLESWLIGFKSAPTEHTTLEAMIGRPELRVDGLTVPGQTFKLTFICKMDEADTVAFNGEVTNWTRKTRETPSTVTGKFRLDLAKGF